MTTESFFFTFGVGSPLAKHHVEIKVIKAEAFGGEIDFYYIARSAMLNTFGAKWAFQYGRESFEGVRERYPSTSFATFEVIADAMGAFSMTLLPSERPEIEGVPTKPVPIEGGIS